MINEEDIKIKYGLNNLCIDAQYNNENNLFLIDKALSQLSSTMNIPKKKIGCNLLNITISPKAPQMGFHINDKLNINFLDINQISKLAHEWFHFADFYSNNLGYNPGNTLLSEPKFMSEEKNSMFHPILDKFNNVVDVAKKEEIIKKYISNIDSSLILNIVNGDYSLIKDFKGLSHLKAEMESSNKTFFDKAKTFDFHLMNGNKYHQKKTEMLARSFETYVAEKLGSESLIAKSNFFSNLYPQENLKTTTFNLWENTVKELTEVILIKPKLNEFLHKMRVNAVTHKLKI